MRQHNLSVKRTGRKISPRREIQETLRIRRGFEKNLETQLGRFQKTLASEAAKEYEQSGNYDSDRLSVVLNQLLVPHYRSVVLAFAQRASESYQRRSAKRSFDDLVSIYLSEQGGQRIRRVWQRYRTIIAQEIATGQREGLSVPNIGKKLRESRLIDSPLRAATIARTETHSASQWANHEQHKEMMPANTLKQWVAVGDPRTRSHHAAMNGKQVGIDEDFEVITAGIPIPMSYAGDPRGGAANVINCRCQVIYVEPDDVVDEEAPQASKEPWLYADGIKPSGDVDDWTRDVGFNMDFIDDDISNQTIRDFAIEEFGMSPDEIRVIMAYTGNLYRDMNSKLRDWFYNKGTVFPYEKEALVGINKKIADGLRKMPAYSGPSARGISVTGDPRKWADLNEIKAGSIYRAESVFSSTQGRRVNRGFEGNVAYYIESKNGRYVDDISVNSGEREVLFPAGHEFKIDRVEWNDDEDILEIFMTDISEGIKSQDGIITLMETKGAKRLREVFQSEAPLASVNTVLISGV
jgi:hypothetical protein